MFFVCFCFASELLKYVKLEASSVSEGEVTGENNKIDIAA